MRDFQIVDFFLGHKEGEEARRLLKECDLLDTALADRNNRHAWTGDLHHGVSLRLPVEDARIGLLLDRLPPPPGGLLVDRAGVEVGVDAHLLAWHRIERKSCADLGDAFGALGNHDELDERQNQKDDCPHYVVAANHEMSEGVDDFARVGLQQDESSRRYV